MRGTHTLDGQPAFARLGLGAPVLRRAAPLAGFVLASLASTAVADVSITFTTTPNGGEYAPKNVVSAWIETVVPGQPQQEVFVKTIGVHAAERQINLIAWQLIAGPNDTDAIAGAARLDHLTPLTITWNLRDKAGNLVPDGTYRIRLELADSNAQTRADNRQGAFTFIKSAMPEVQTALASGGFVDATIDFQPVLCDNGVVDPGETCDSAIAGSCPTTCAAGPSTCSPSALVGDPVTCSAACTITAITSCLDDDGCCAPGCAAVNDSDCEGIDQENVSSGCEAGGGAGLAFAAFGLGILLLRRRR